MIGLRVEMAEFHRELAAKAARVGDLMPVARDFGGHVVSDIKRRMPSQHEPSSPGGFPASHRRGRGLSGSISSIELAGGKGVDIGTPLVYGGVLHHGTEKYLGGPIKPKRAKALAIPLPAARGKRPRDFGDLQWRPNRQPSRIKRGVLGTLVGDKFTPLFALQTEVTIEPRPWLMITEEHWEYLDTVLTAHMDN